MGIFLYERDRRLFSAPSRLFSAWAVAHTNLFKAGLARSGAYNRTLTPFGFRPGPPV